ncbi:hypothetical protein C8Q79DRAFT_996415 [Trametes meyenii]|nr:hypothetical protein C8Q79DRAFT_996415 [Trametes meyenii]
MSSSPVFPPSAHLSSSPSPLDLRHIQSQPPTHPPMAPTAPSPTNRTGPAQRIRGGCIPCPDGSICYIIPIPCFCC